MRCPTFGRNLLIGTSPFLHASQSMAKLRANPGASVMRALSCITPPATSALRAPR